MNFIYKEKGVYSYALSANVNVDNWGSYLKLVSIEKIWFYRLS